MRKLSERLIEAKNEITENSIQRLPRELAEKVRQIFVPLHDTAWKMEEALSDIIADFEDGDVTQASINKAKRALGKMK
jgi:hypothetical protein